MRLWIYASLGIWGTRVGGILGQDILRMETVYGLVWACLGFHFQQIFQSKIAYSHEGRH